MLQADVVGEEVEDIGALAPFIFLDKITYHLTLIINIKLKSQ